MRAAWVVGCGGLLGGALVRELRGAGTPVFQQRVPFQWRNETEICGQLASAVGDFARWVGACPSVEIYWAAGVGGMGSTEMEMAAETRCLEVLLEVLGTHRGQPVARAAVALASSAGGIYAGSSAAIVDESTTPMPTTAYARGKLQQEDAVLRSPLRAAGGGVLIARISTLYGPGQATGKRQGLITHVARSVLRSQPVRIYVPLDTVRDYIYSADAARIMVASLRSTVGGQQPAVKIVASEKPTTIAEILGTCRRIARRRLLFTTTADALSDLYKHRARYKSRVFPEHSRLATTTLAQGFARVLAAERKTIGAPDRDDASERAEGP